MKLKVCGMREPENVQEVLRIEPDLMGFIFYEQSERFVGDAVPDFAAETDCKRVGVFVNESLEGLTQKYRKHNLDLVQLHGDETVEYVEQLHGKGVPAMKVFRISDSIDNQLMTRFAPYCDYFLFDTKVDGYGGSGQKFDWKLLGDYAVDVPFFLSGGINLEDLEEITKMQLPMMAGIDVNSRFEIEPGLKDISKLEKLKEIWENV